MEEQVETQDPLDLAVEMLFQVLGSLKEPTGSKLDSARTVLMVAQTTALIDLAKSTRVLNDHLSTLERLLGGFKPSPRNT